MQALETHIYNYRAWIKLTDPIALTAIFKEMLNKAGYGIVNFTEHHFQPQGYTCIWLLSESHLAIHTFPEEGKTYVELSGCSEEMNIRFMEQFEAKIDQHQLIESSKS